MFAKKVFGKPEVVEEEPFDGHFQFSEILAYCSFTSRGDTVTNEDYSKTKHVPLQSAFLFSTVNSKRKCLHQPSRNKYNKRIPYNLRQISRMDLKRENASDQVEVRCGFTSIFRRGWCAISGYCRHPLDYCFIRTAPCY